MALPDRSDREGAASSDAASTPLPFSSGLERQASRAQRCTATVGLTNEDAAAISAFADSTQISPQSFLAAGWAVLLHRYSGEAEVCFAAALSGSDVEEPRRPPHVRIDARIAPEASVRDWFRRIHEKLRAATRSAPREEPPTGAGTEPVYQTLVLAPPGSPTHSDPSTAASLATLAENAAAPGVSIGLSLSDSEASIHAEFDGSMGPGNVERMLGHLVNILRDALDDAARPVADLRLLDPEEERSITKGFNDTSTSYPHGSLNTLLQEQAEATPGAIALSFEGRTLTYAELHQRANRLAHFLRDAGVGPESLVGVLMERSVELVVALLGVIKAGGAYVPLDPEYPRARLEAMLEDADPSMILTQEHLRASVPDTSVPVTAVDPSLACAAGFAGTDPAVALAGDNAAYVIFTSGSTGRPKGVVNTHRGICNRLLWMQEAFELGADDRILQKTPFSFDVSVWEFFWPLIEGARLVVARPGGHRDPSYLVDRIVADRITTIHFVPSMLQAFLRAPIERCTTLRRIICSGEALSWELKEETLERLPWAELHNLYGPTEAAIDVTWWPCRRGGDGVSVPIGRPVANTSVYILDPAGRPVPVGVQGELCIGGVQVARGYIDRPELTAEKFVPDPFADDPEARLYKTGDLARYAPDGTIEFLGRIDHQVKIHGHRIELGEIEAALLEHRAVEECVVSTPSVDNGDRRLVAYVVPGSDERTAHPESRHVDRWREVYDGVYSGEGSSAEAGFDTAGWISSYTGLPIPDEEMKEWLEHTVRRIRALKPQRALEIGGGTGMILFRLAEDCETYWATDISKKVVDTLRRRLAEHPAGLERVRVLQRGATDFEDLPAELDTVILNSVCQFFPGAAYFVEVLDKAVGAVGSTGNVFVGDVRSLPLLELFAASTELARAEPGLPARRLAERVRIRVAEEEELVVAPGFFELFAARDERVAGCDVELKRGARHNELTRFRYDVVLHVGDGSARSQTPVQPWMPGSSSIEELADRLAATAPDELCVKKVPNARIQEDLLALELVEGADPGVTVGELREQARDLARRTDGVDPEDFWALQETLPYRVRVTWSRDSAGHFDVHLRRNDLQTTRNDARHRPAATAVSGSFDELTNEPRRGVFLRRLGGELREHLRERLPDYMVPGAFVHLGGMPILPNGKVDRRALPLPEGPVAARRDSEPAATETETRMVEIWSDAIGVAGIGVTDSFFEIGGDSILALGVVERARARGMDVLPADLFEAGTIRALAHIIDSRPALGVADRQAPASHDPSTTLPQGHDAGATAATSSYPLSPLQEGMLFHHLYTPESSLYFVQVHGKLRTRLGVPLFERAWQIVVDRHEVLRTSFDVDAAEPRQVVRDDVSLAVQVDDWRAHGDEERQEKLGALRDGRRDGYTLNQAPLMSVKLVRLEDDLWELVWNVHHIIVDGWSMLIVLKDVMSAYESLREGKEVRVSAELRYRDYIAWLASRDEAQDSRYWRRLLRGFKEPTPIPGERASRSAAEAVESALRRRTLRLPEPDCEALRAFAKRHRVTLSAVFSAAWGLALGRHAAADDVVFGCVVPTRSPELPGAVSAVGLYMNSVPVRLRLDPDQPVSSWLRAHQGDLIEGRGHGYASLANIQSWSEVASGAPLFNSLIAVHGFLRNETSSSWARKQLGLEDFGYVDWNTFPLSVEVEAGRELEALLKYDVDRLDEVAVNRFIDDLRAILRRIADADHDRVGTLADGLAGRQHGEQVRRRFRKKSMRPSKTPVPRRGSRHGITKEDDQ